MLKKLRSRLTVLASALTVPLLAALFWKRATPMAGVVSMVVGGAGCMIWEAMKLATPSIFIGLGLSLVAMLVVSYAQKAPENLPKWMD